MKDVLLKIYRYVVWTYGYKFFLRMQGYRWLGQAHGTNVPGAFRILTFHDVPRDQHKAFERLLRHVIEVHGVLTPDEAEARLRGNWPRAADERVPCLLTFDDGFASNVTVAKEVLSRLNLKAVFFLCPGLLDVAPEKQRQAISHNLHEGWLKETEIGDDMKLTDWRGAEQLVKLGQTIGSHTMHHFRLSGLTDEKRSEEIVGSADLLEERLKTTVNWFAYPFGDLSSIDPVSFRIIASRYSFCCSGLRGVNSINTRPIALLREAVDLTSPVEFQDLVLNGGMDFRHQKKVAKLAELVSASLVRDNAPTVA
jgi:peptidoglycan/xylan/chitin deacetylase (PgdA/CDA1 family)